MHPAPKPVFSPSLGRLALRALLVFFLGVFLFSSLAVNALAASEKVEEVLAQLGSLQRANIDPAWPPDIAANEAMVSALLADYKALSASQKAELSAPQNADLRAYFEALYTAQGKNPKEVSQLFQGGGAGSASSSSKAAAASSSKGASPSSGSASSSSKAASSSSKSASSSSASSRSSSNYSPANEVLSPTTSASPSTSPLAPSSVSASSGSASLSSSVSMASSTASSSSTSALVGALPSATFPPQIPTTSSFFTFLGSASLGSFFLVTLCALLAFIFLRFLFAVHAAGPAPGTKRAEKLARHKALLLGQEEAFATPVLPEGALLDPHFDAEPLALTRAEQRALRKEQKIRLRNSEKQSQSALNTLPPEGRFQMDTQAGPNWASTKPINPAEMDAIARLFQEGDKEKTSPAPTAEGQGSPPPAEDASAEKRPAAKGARTGRPNRIRFSQGDAHDIDAIDD